MAKKKLKQPPQNIRITVTEPIAYLISDACHVLARIRLNQVGIALEEMAPRLSEDALKSMRQLVHQIDDLLRDEPRGDHREIWEVHEVLRHFLSWRNYPEGGMEIIFHDPLNSVGIGIEPTDDVPDNRPVRAKLAKELTDLIGTNDLAEAVKRVKDWKEKAKKLSNLDKKLVTARKRKP